MWAQGPAAIVDLTNPERPPWRAALPMTGPRAVSVIGGERLCALARFRGLAASARALRRGSANGILALARGQGQPVPSPHRSRNAPPSGERSGQTISLGRSQGNTVHGEALAAVSQAGHMCLGPSGPQNALIFVLALVEFGSRRLLRARCSQRVRQPSETRRPLVSPWCRWRALAKVARTGGGSDAFREANRGSHSTCADTRPVADDFDAVSSKPRAFRRYTWLLASPAEHSRGRLFRPARSCSQEGGTPPLVPRLRVAFIAQRGPGLRGTGCTAQNAALQSPPPRVASDASTAQRQTGEGCQSTTSSRNAHAPFRSEPPSVAIQQPPKTPAAESLAGCDGRTDQCPNRQACGVTPQPKVHNPTTAPTHDSARISNRRHSIDRQLACRIRNFSLWQVDDALACHVAGRANRCAEARHAQKSSNPYPSYVDPDPTNPYP